MNKQAISKNDLIKLYNKVEDFNCISLEKRKKLFSLMKDRTNEECFDIQSPLAFLIKRDLLNCTISVECNIFVQDDEIQIEYPAQSQVLKGYIYRLTNSITGQQYVGQTIDVNSRMNQHKFAALNGDPKKLYLNIRDYGWNNFTHEIIKEVECETKDELKRTLNYWESFYIEEIFSDECLCLNTSKGNYIASKTNEALYLSNLYQYRTALLRFNSKSYNERKRLFEYNYNETYQYYPGILKREEDCTFYLEGTVFYKDYCQPKDVDSTWFPPKDKVYKKKLKYNIDFSKFKNVPYEYRPLY